MPYIGNQHNVGDHVNNFKVLDDISSHTATFDGSATSVVSAADDTIRIPEHRFIQGQRVTYTNGGGGNIGGLTTGTAYFVSFDSANTIKLATTLANANSNTVINISAVGSGTSHTLNAAFDGVNTKFKMTYSSGKSARLNNATQLNVAINNVIQRPNLDPNNFTDGFALQDNHKIVFKTAPTVNDIFWGSIIANTIENFDLRDNEVDNFTGDGSTTEFTLSTIPANNESVIVSINGVVQHPSDKNTARSYTLIDSIIQFTAAPALGDGIQVRHIGFAGASTNDVSGFYGRTGNVALTSSDHITTGDITSRNINSSGIITATTFSGGFSGNVVGTSATFTGNLSVGGVLTYEDVTNVDSVGIITAQKDIHVGAGVSAVGVGTFGSLDIGGDIDVDGHTNLDNISIAGVTTTTGNIHLNSGAKVGFATDSNTFIGQDDYDRLDFNVGGKRLASIVEGTNIPVLVIDKDGINNARPNQSTNYNANPNATELVLGNTSSNNHGMTIVSPSSGYGNIQFSDGSGGGLDSTRGSIVFTHSDNKLNLKSKIGSIALTHKDVEKLVTTDTGISIPQDLDVDGHTNLDNVSVSGILTATGEIRSQDDIRIQSVYPRLYLTDTDSNDDFSLINNNGSFLIYNDTQNDFRLKIDGTTGMCAMTLRPTADSTYNLGTNTLRWANVYADTLYGDGSNLTGITQTTINNNADNRVITGSGTANTLEADANLTWNNSTGQLVVGASGSGYVSVRRPAIAQVDIQHSTTNSYSRLYMSQSSGSGGYFAINKIGTVDLGYTGGANAVQLWSSADAPMLFATNNSEKVRITSDGKLGVGIDTPTEIFHIKKNDTTGPTITLENNANKAYINNWGSAGGGSGRTNRFEINATSQAQASICAPYITFMTGGVGDSYERLRITSDGNAVLGGTTINTAQDKAFSIFGTNGSELKLQATNFGGTAADGGAALTCTFGSLFLTNNNTNGDIHFQTKKSGESTSEKMRITESGYVGINSTSPAAYLDIGPHNTGNSTLRVRNHTSAGAFVNNYGSEFRHSFNAINHGMLIHTQEAADARRTLDISDANGIFATFTNGKFGAGITTPQRRLHVKSGANNNDGAFRIESAPGNIMDMGTDGSMHFLNCVNNDPFRIKFAGNEALRLTHETSGNGSTTLQFYMVTNNSQGATPYIKGVCGTEAGGADANNDGGLEFHTKTGGSGTDVNAVRINANGRVAIGAHNIQNPTAALHIIGDTSGSNTALQVGQDSGQRYFRVNEINGQSNFLECLLSYYDNTLAHQLKLQNTFAGSPNFGSAIQFIGHGGNQTGRIAVKNRDANSASNSIMELSASYITKPSHPYFDVSRDNGAVSSTNVIVYNSVYTNNGGHYSSSNGRFTAPVDGFYQFWYGHIKNNTSDVVRSKFRKNGGSYLHGNRELRMDSGSQYGDNGAITIITELNANDYIEIVVTAGTVYATANEYGYFCGTLLG